MIKRLPEIEKARNLDDQSLEVAGVVTNVEGGEVLALVGGRNVRFPGFNRALDAKRQIGSLVKPFIFRPPCRGPIAITFTPGCRISRSK